SGASICDKTASRTPYKAAGTPVAVRRRACRAGRDERSTPVGETVEQTAREVEQTRRQMEEKLSKLSERAPQEGRKLAKRVIFVGITGVAVVLVRKLVDRAWTRVTGEPPPTKRFRR